MRHDSNVAAKLRENSGKKIKSMGNRFGESVPDQPMRLELGFEEDQSDISTRVNFID